jgi:DNA topoisomerase-2
MTKKKTIEETYKKLTQREHVLHRPGMYIGSVQKLFEDMWVMGEEKMEKKTVGYSPGFLKIFDEVLTNATDHSARDNTVTTIKVQLDSKTGEISVFNNGAGIPVVLHKEHNIYVPELIFGHLLSGSNYDDTQQRTGAGTNGLGSKVSNIFSKKFTVETIDSERGLKFVQEYTDNMETKSAAKITKNSGKSYTKITFTPDYKRFSMKGLEEDTIGLLKKRVFDCIACTGNSVSVYLNGEKLKGKGLQDYVKYFFEEKSGIKTFYEESIQKVGKVDYIWEYVLVPWERFEHVSFVNGNCTHQGGKHVDNIMTQVTNKIKVMLESKKKLKDVKPHIIREKMFLFLRATVVNPQFSSQAKEFLTTNVKDFGCKIEVSDKLIEKLWKSSIIEEIVQFCAIKESLDLARTTDGKKKNKIFIPKLEDALWAGTAKSDKCTLILTEGDSAKTFAMWGRSVVGADTYGIMPLKGKMLNVRDATIQQLIGNEELNNLKQILGLKQGKEYSDTSDLRYGKVMCLTDADTDGSHIKSLLVNFFHAQWPSLIKLDFIQTLRTPIIKAVKGKKILEFFTEQDYNKWKVSVNTSSYHIRYFKGLGTSQKTDAHDTFKRIDELKVDYYYKNKACDESILLAFDKDKNVKANLKVQAKDDTESVNSDETTALVKCSDKRKTWLSNYDKNSYIDTKENKVSYQDLINKELIHFSIYDNTRSIPSLCDGLKPSQRKILYYMLKKNITKTIKVAQLSGYVSAETGYHHGENSLQQAIVGMAQNFVGSNNVNLLYPDGSFGSRLLGGKDAASARYIFTYLSQITPLIFNGQDTPLLTFQNDDGQQIEPEWYIPVLPMVLVNGCEGIGTGYSTYIPPYNPKDIVANILRIIKDEQPLQMKPYFRNFGGDVVEIEPGSYVTKGKWERISDGQIKITELPIGGWVTPYKEFLESMIDGTTLSKKEKDAGKKKKVSSIVLKDVQNKTKDEDTGICFVVDFKDVSVLDKLIKENTLEKELKLIKAFNTNNMYLFDTDSIPSKYKTATDILLDFCDIRLEFYGKRKQYLLKKWSDELVVMENKVRFINDYINGTLEINRRTKAHVIALLEERGFSKYCDEESTTKSYDYLIKLPLLSLTQERIEDLNKQTRSKQQQIDDLTNKTDKDLWKEDLKDICKYLN